MDKCTLPFCCGIYEFGDFEDWESDTDNSPSKAICKEWFEQIQQIMQDHKKGYYYVAFFQRNKKFDGTFERNYEAAHLATLISRLPGCKKIKPTINPNSGNMIKGYIWQQS